MTTCTNHKPAPVLYLLPALLLPRLSILRVRIIGPVPVHVLGMWLYSSSGFSELYPMTSYAPSPPTIAMVTTSSCTGGLGGSGLEYTHRITSLSSSPVMCELKGNASDKKTGGGFGNTASLIVFSCAQEKKWV